MISKGANNWNLALRGSCYKGHKELALFMIIKGADISECKISLEFEDIYYLRESGIKEFGKYSDIADECKKFKHASASLRGKVPKYNK